MQKIIGRLKRIYHYLKSLIYILKLPSLKGENVVLILNHFYDQDIRALVNANESESEFEFVVLDPAHLFAPIISLFPDEIKLAKIPYDSDEVQRHRKISVKISKLIYRMVFSKIKFSGIVTPSDLFYWFREFITIARENDIPTIVLDKEGTISPYDFEFFSRQIRTLFPPISDHFIVWSESQRDFWINSGVSPDNIKVIGQPRSDLLFSLEPGEMNLFENDHNPMILFFTYELNAYIPPQKHKDQNLTWDELRKKTHNQIKRLARAHEEVNFVVKCHPQQLDAIDVQKEFEGMDNVKVLTGASSSSQLLINSSLVIGFQTTALIEAVLLRKPTIYTYFTEETKILKEDILPFNEYDVLNVVTSEEQLFTEVNDYVNNNFEFTSTEKSRDHLLKRYLNNPDGKVSKRVLEHLIQFLSDWKFSKKN